jgi:beta-lactamase class A
MQVTRRSALIGSLGLLGPIAAHARTISAVTTYEAVTGGHVGIYAENVGSGARMAWRADERFVMCSTFKASLVALILRRVDRREDHLDIPIAYTQADLPDWHAPVARANLAKGALSVGEMCKAAVEQSDNTCASLLLARVGGPVVLTSFWRACGDGVSRLDDPEPLLNRTPLGDDRDTTTPRAMAQNFRRFVLGDVLSPSSRMRLKMWLIGAVTGFDRLRAGLPKGWVVGDKTGNNGVDAAGDVAIVWPRTDEPILICAYTRGGTPTDRQLRTLFSAIGEAAALRLA